MNSVVDTHKLRKIGTETGQRNDPLRLNKKVSFGGISQNDMSVILEQQSSASNKHLDHMVTKTSEYHKAKGEKFEDHYKNKRLQDRVSNHEGIKKSMLKDGLLKKNAFKVYYYPNNPG